MIQKTILLLLNFILDFFLNQTKILSLFCISDWGRGWSIRQGYKFQEVKGGVKSSKLFTYCHYKVMHVNIARQLKEKKFLLCTGAGITKGRLTFFLGGGNSTND